MSESIDFYSPAWSQEAPDKAVEAVRAMLLRRSQAGIKEYGVSTDRDDLALEEVLDMAVYLQRALHEVEREMDGGK